jgi:hypothetical protein
MNEPSYPLQASSDGLEFDFESVSEEKIIRKRLRFSAFSEAPWIYNLALFDVLPDGLIDDLSISDNRDLRTVLATVVEGLRKFFAAHPDKTVFFTGSTHSRTRLYRIAIAQNAVKAEPYFEIYGLVGNRPERFQSNRPYDGFLINWKPG